MFSLTDELRELQKSAARFADKEIAAKALTWDDHPEGFPWDLVRAAGAAGFLNYHLPLPDESGKIGAEPVLPGPIPTLVLLEELAAANAGAAMIVGTHVLASLPILLCQDPAVRRIFIPALINSLSTERPSLFAPALAEFEERIMTTLSAVDDGYVINGRKRMVRLGSAAEYFTVLVSLGPESAEAAHTLAIIPRGTNGCSVEKTEHMLGWNICPMTEVLFEDCRIPREYVLAPGKARQMLGDLMTNACAIIAAVAIGTTRGAFNTAIHYASMRYQGGKMIIDHDAVATMLIDIETRLNTARAALFQAAGEARPHRKDLAMAKIFASEIAVTSCLDAVQVMGGYGYMHEYGQEMRLRDAQMTIHYDETNQTLRELVLKLTRQEMEL